MTHKPFACIKEQLDL